MTIARDIRTGAVVGQPVRLPLDVEVACRTAYDDPERFTSHGMICLLTRNDYTWVPAASVRLEEV